MSETKTLEQIRGSCAEVCANAVKNLFPTTLLLGGGTTDYGFYYDFAIENQNVDQKAIDLITDEMFKIIDSEAEIEASEMLATNAVDFFLHKAQPLVSKQLEFSETDLVGIVRIGDFYDITSSSIVTDIKDLKNFKLQQIDHITEEYEGLGELQVTRITGTACITGRDLKHFLKGLESSKKHGHEALGKEMELFEFNDVHECTWFPNGVALRNLLKEWLSKENEAQSYFRVKSSSTVPSHIAASHLSLFTKKFDQEYSLPIRTTEIFDDTMEIKKISYRGLWRCTNFTCDIQYNFCTKLQALNEIISSLQFISKTVKMFGSESCWIVTGLRKRRVGWKKGGELLVKALEACGFEYECDEEDTDDAANGPKAYLSFTDSNGKQWKGSYVGVEVEFPNAPQGVEVISRSTFGSLERAIAHLLEHYKGKLPLQWAPLQLRLLLPGERLNAYASQVKEQAQQAGIRVDTDATMRKLGAKVHQAELENIPYIAVIGEREEKQQTICVRASNPKHSDRQENVNDFISRITEKSKENSLPH